MNKVNGILLLYHHPMRKDANTIFEHIRAFEKFSIFKVYSINTELGFPYQLFNFSFAIIIIHYSMFKSYTFSYIRKYLELNKDSYIIAFFQDEHHFCKERFELINNYAVDCVYTLIEPKYFKETYQKYTNVKKIINCLPGYVSDEIIEAARKYSLPDEYRPIDIGYRGRPLPYYMGKGSQEKTEIGEIFLEKSVHFSLKLDIKTEERERIYGKDWYAFLGKCKGMLGVEAGVSIFDIDDSIFCNFQKLVGVYNYDEIVSKRPRYTFDEVSEKLQLYNYEGNIYYRTISPRIFEAAAFSICQILYEGNYSNILKPGVHYLPLKKDFSNFNEIIHCFSDPSIRKKIVENAYKDLIQSNHYSYQMFIHGFDRNLIESGLNPNINKKEAEQIDSIIHRWSLSATLTKKVSLYFSRIIIRVITLFS